MFVNLFGLLLSSLCSFFLIWGKLPEINEINERITDCSKENLQITNRVPSTPFSSFLLPHLSLPSPPFSSLPLPYLLLPLLPFIPALPLEVGAPYSSYGVWRSIVCSTRPMPKFHPLPSTIPLVQKLLHVHGIPMRIPIVQSNGIKSTTLISHIKYVVVEWQRQNMVHSVSGCVLGVQI